MLEPKCQVPVYKGNEQTHVFDQVRAPMLLIVCCEAYLTRRYRQVQDLEKELSHTRKQLHELRSMAKEGDSFDHTSGTYPDKKRLHIDTAQRKRSKPIVKQDLSRVRASLRKVGIGVFKPPYPHRQLLSCPKLSTSVLPGLPSRHVADEILAQYHASFHATLPILHWPSFIQQYEAVYQEGSLRAVQRIWGALLFAVLGCGTLHRGSQDGQNYLELSKSLIDPWDEDLSLDHTRCALLISILLVEMNSKSAGWVWLGNAVRMAQDIGIHCESQARSTVEDEMRRRVWWSIYACDRSAA